MKIALGMVWYRDGFRDEVTKIFKNGKVQITETWISEDTWKECKSVENYNVSEDEDGEQFAWREKNKEYAFDEKEENGYKWWARTYACGAVNAQEFAEQERKEQETNNNSNKEEKEMNGTKRSFTVEGTVYTETEKGYFYKSTGTVDKKGNSVMMRIARKVFEEAWEASGEAKKAKRQRMQEQSDKEAEKAMNTSKSAPKANKKASKPHKSKDVAYEGNGVTLTAKQVKFISRMPEDNFYENGLESTLWIDVYCDTLADEFSPMAVGAMVSTLKEKDLISVSKERVNGRVSKYFAFTELGTKVAKELGLN